MAHSPFIKGISILNLPPILSYCKRLIRIYPIGWWSSTYCLFPCINYNLHIRIWNIFWFFCSTLTNDIWILLFIVSGNSSFLCNKLFTFIKLILFISYLPFFEHIIATSTRIYYRKINNFSWIYPESSLKSCVLSGLVCCIYYYLDIVVRVFSRSIMIFYDISSYTYRNFDNNSFTIWIFNQNLGCNISTLIYIWTSVIIISRSIWLFVLIFYQVTSFWCSSYWSCNIFLRSWGF